MGGELLIQTADVSHRFSLLSFIWKHLYLIVLILFTVPLIISTINLSIQENNPAIPFLTLGLSIFNADTTLYHYITDLQTNPSNAIGMEKQDGIYLTFIYYVKCFLVIWKILGLLLFLTLPFVVVYNLLKMKNSTSQGQNMVSSILISIVFMFFMNLIMTIHGLATGSLTMTPPPSSFFGESLWIIKQVAPFHGVFSLIVYLISLIR
jgi:hypothetical protein